MITTAKVAVLDPDTGQQGPFVTNSGLSAYSGDTVRYQENLINTGLEDYNSLDVLDVLPYDGDLLVDGSPRGSQTSIALASPLSITRTDKDNKEIQGGYKVLYSTDKPSSNAHDNYSAKFSEDAPTDLSKVTMVRVVSTTPTPLNVGDNLKITYDAKIPHLDSVKTAVNTFTVRKAEGDQNLTQSTDAIINAQQPLANVTIQFYGKKNR